MQLTLKQARRLEREIEAEQQLRAASINTHGIQISIHENFAEKLFDLQKDTIATVDVCFKMATLRYKIRKSIETDNELSGINLFMNQEALLKNKQKILTDVMTPEFTVSELSIAKKRHDAACTAGGASMGSHTSAMVDYTTVRNTMIKDTLDIFKAQAKDVQRALLKLVDQMTALNSTRTIEISDEDAAFLESLNIVV
jgi:hypothetical protein